MSPSVRGVRLCAKTGNRAYADYLPCLHGELLDVLDPCYTVVEDGKTVAVET